jgi:GMP synthase (glutamine-hydrolysing)
MKGKVVILDFGSQYTQLIARRVREWNVFCEIHPYNTDLSTLGEVNAVILSGSPFSVKDEEAIIADLDAIIGHYPVLGICYGAQHIADHLGGTVSRSDKREYGRASLAEVIHDDLFHGVTPDSQVWMSHGDTIVELPEGFEILARTESIPVAAFRSTGSIDKPVYCLQFHPEVTHSVDGKTILYNFIVNIAGVEQSWTPDSFVEETVTKLKQRIGESAHVIMGLSGGVDSTVAATLLSRAIGDRLLCVFVDNGLLRKHEFEEVLELCKDLGLNVQGVDARLKFYAALAGESDPEKKRKIIGGMFIEVFQDVAKDHPEMDYLGQGTIYPDVIESVSVHGPSVTIKSHHNVGGLPDKLHLKIVEPLRMLFKDEVRRVGRALGIPPHLIGRHPFPGPGLGIRILGDITPEKVAILQEADAIYIDHLRKADYYDKIWQAGAILLPFQSVGVMGDERTYERTIALRAVNSMDGMTAEWSKLPHDLLADISSDIINRVKGINRVVYDISTKPPATIEWE